MRIKLTLFEIINFSLSIITLLLSLLLSKPSLSYGGFSLLLASVISILFVKFSPLKFKKFDINMLQLHIFISIFLGTTLNFYSIINQFDFYLHFFFGFIFSVLSIPVINYFIENSNLNKNDFSIAFIIFMIFCFSSTCGVVWEMYEFTIDNLFNLNTQNNSLLDTMSDIIANTSGIIIFCTLYFFKKRKQAK